MLLSFMSLVLTIAQHCLKRNQLDDQWQHSHVTVVVYCAGFVLC